MSPDLVQRARRLSRQRIRTRVLLRQSAAAARRPDAPPRVPRPR